LPVLATGRARTLAVRAGRHVRGRSRGRRDQRLVRNTLRILAREGYGVAEVLERLNELIVEEGDQARFVTLVRGEVAGPELRLSLVCAGYPEPLLPASGGPPDPPAGPQLLLGVLIGQRFHARDPTLSAGDVLLVASNGVTKRRDGYRLLDDAGGLAALFGRRLAAEVAASVVRAAREFGAAPLTDDLRCWCWRPPGRMVTGRLAAAGLSGDGAQRRRGSAASGSVKVSPRSPRLTSSADLAASARRLPSAW
jgi:hypothetical protein